MNIQIKTIIGAIVIFAIAIGSGVLVYKIQKDRQEQARLTLLNIQHNELTNTQDQKTNKDVPKTGNQQVCTTDAKKCPDGTFVSRTGPNCEFKSCPGENNLGSGVGIANPASVFCKENGGKLEIRTGEGGGQIGICKFFDGSECEEWKFMRGECKMGDSQNNTTTDTSDWQTYRNEKIDIIFDYPDNWILSLENTYFNDDYFQIYFNTNNDNIIKILGNNDPIANKDYIQPYFDMCAQVNKGLKQFCEGVDCIYINKKTAMRYESLMMGDRVYMAYIYSELSRKYPFLCIEASINEMYDANGLEKYFRKKYSDIDVSAYISSNEIKKDVKEYTDSLYKFASSLEKND